MLISSNFPPVIQPPQAMPDLDKATVLPVPSSVSSMAGHLLLGGVGGLAGGFIGKFVAGPIVGVALGSGVGTAAGEALAQIIFDDQNLGTLDWSLVVSAGMVAGIMGWSGSLSNLASAKNPIAIQGVYKSLVPVARFLTGYHRGRVLSQMGQRAVVNMGTGVLGRTITEEVKAVQNNNAGAISTINFWKKILNPADLALDIGFGEIIYFGSSGIFRRSRLNLYSSDSLEAMVARQDHDAQVVLTKYYQGLSLNDLFYYSKRDGHILAQAELQTKYSCLQPSDYPNLRSDVLKDRIENYGDELARGELTQRYSEVGDGYLARYAEGNDSFALAEIERRRQVGQAEDFERRKANEPKVEYTDSTYVRDQVASFDGPWEIWVLDDAGQDYLDAIADQATANLLTAEVKVEGNVIFRKFSGPGEAMELLEQGPIKLAGVISDQNMGWGMNGTTFLREVDARYPDLPLCLQSGDVSGALDVSPTFEALAKNAKERISLCGKYVDIKFIKNVIARIKGAIIL